MQLRSIGAAVVYVITVGLTGTSMAGELPDIAGIRFGVPHKDAAALVRAVDAKLVVTEITSRGGRPAGWKGLADHDKLLVLTDDANNDIWYVGRQQLLDAGEHIDPEQLRKSLVEKYGPPTLGLDRGSSILVWDFDRRGRLAKPGQHLGGVGPCPPVQESMAVPGVAFEVPLQFMAACGLHISATYFLDPKDHFVSAWTIRMIHDSVRFDELDAKAKSSDAAKAAERAREAANNKPKL